MSALSDHYPVCITRKLSKSFENGPVHKFISYWNIKTFDLTRFLNTLASQPWSVLDTFDDASDALDSFSDIFNSVLSTHAPKKKRRDKRQKQPNWINTAILIAMKTRDQYHKSKNSSQYTLWRNKSKTVLRKSKSKLYISYLDSIINSSNPKRL